MRSLNESRGGEETQIPLMRRREEERVRRSPSRSHSSPLRLLHCLCASAVGMICLFLLFFFWCFAPFSVTAQSGETTGRVVTEDKTASPEAEINLTYRPSSTLDTAAEVVAASGGEAGGVNIRHRGEQGRSISGVVSGAAGAETAPAVWVMIYDWPAGTGAASSFIQAGVSRGFTFQGLPEGEYLITARTDKQENNQASVQRRVSLRGRDITGLELKLLPLGSISGRILVESLSAGCDEKGKLRLEEFGVSVVRDDLPRDGSVFTPWQSFSMPGADEKGEFTISSIDPGHYRIGIRLPDENLYVKTISAQAGVAARKGAPAGVNSVSRDGLALKQGEKFSGVTVTVSEGAASLSGKVVAEKEGERLPERLRAYLVPAEPNTSDDVLRYAEAIVSSDSSFAFTNIAPGKYRLVTRVTSNDESSNRPATPPAWDANERARLRRQAMAAKYEIEFQPCGRVKDFVFKLDR